MTRATTMAEAPASHAGEATVTAHEMARLTGVGRERLRTWERRHGFPIPTQSSHGNRQYRSDDVARVIAVRQLAQQGVPLAQAVENVLRGETADDQALESLGPALDAAHAPAIALGGPLPLRVLWVNAQAQAAGDLPAVGDELDAQSPFLGREATESIERLMAEQRDDALVIEHGVASGTGDARRSLAWRASTLRSGQPVVVLMELPAGSVVDLHGPLHAQALRADVGRWVEGVREARAVLAEQSGLTGAQRSLRTLRESLGAIDALLVFPDKEQLRCATSVRRIIASRVVASIDCAQVPEALSSGDVRWLEAAAGRALGVPAGMRGVVIPLVAAGTGVGAAVLVFPGQFAIDDLAVEVALGYGTMLATMVQRDQAAARNRHAQQLASGHRPHVLA